MEYKIHLMMMMNGFLRTYLHLELLPHIFLEIGSSFSRFDGDLVKWFLQIFGFVVCVQSKFHMEIDLRFVNTKDISYRRPTQWTLAAASDTVPLFHRTIVAHAHVSACIQCRINWFFIANGAFDARAQTGCDIFLILSG